MLLVSPSHSRWRKCADMREWRFSCGASRTIRRARTSHAVAALHLSGVHGKRRNGSRYLVPYAHRNRRRCGLHPKEMSVGRTFEYRGNTHPDECLSCPQKAVWQLGGPGEIASWKRKAGNKPPARNHRLLESRPPRPWG